MWRAALVDQLTKQFARTHALNSEYDPHESAIWVETINEDEQLADLIPKLRGALPSSDGSDMYLVVVEMKEKWESIEEYLEPFIKLPDLYRIASGQAEASSLDSNIATSPTRIMSQVQSLAKSIENICQYDPNPPTITIDWTREEARVQNDRALRVGIQLLVAIDNNNNNIAWIPLDGLVIYTGSAGWKPIDAQQLLILSKTSEDIDFETTGILSDFMIKWRDAVLELYNTTVRLANLNAATISEVYERKKLYETAKNFCFLTVMASINIKFNKTPWGEILDRLPLVVREVNGGVPPVINIKRWLERYRHE
jgi:hypothetical protein